MGRSKSGIRVRRELKFAPPWPKLTPAGLPGRQTGDAEREDQRPQRHHQVGGLFPGGRDQDCVRIVRQDDQSLGFGCAGVLKIAPPWPKLTPAGLPGRQTGAVEREDGRAQQLHHVGGLFSGRDQDCVRIGRQDDQSLGFWCAEASNRPSLAKTDAIWLAWQTHWSC